MKSKNLVKGDPLYIGSLNGRDKSGQTKDSSDDDTWQHLDQPSIEWFDAPIPDQATSPSSVRIASTQ